MTNRNRSISALMPIATVILLFIAVWLLTTSYFHLKEIQAGSDGCREIGGTFSLEIHNPLTGSYSFICEE